MTFGSFVKSIVMLVRHSGHKHADAGARIAGMLFA